MAAYYSVLNTTHSIAVVCLGLPVYLSPTLHWEYLTWACPWVPASFVGDQGQCVC